LIPTTVAARWDGANLVLNVRVQPRASRNEVTGVCDGQLRLRTTAAAQGGKANKAVIALVADYLGIAPSRIELRRGWTNRNKQLVVAGPLDLPDGLAVAGPVTNGL
jgi:uncharacterized protein